MTYLTFLKTCESSFQQPRLSNAESHQHCLELSYDTSLLPVLVAGGTAWIAAYGDDWRTGLAPALRVGQSGLRGHSRGTGERQT